MAFDDFTSSTGYDDIAQEESNLLSKLIADDSQSPRSPSPTEGSASRHTQNSSSAPKLADLLNNAGNKAANPAETHENNHHEQMPKPEPFFMPTDWAKATSKDKAAIAGMQELVKRRRV